MKHSGYYELLNQFIETPQVIPKEDLVIPYKPFLE